MDFDSLLVSSTAPSFDFQVNFLEDDVTSFSKISDEEINTFIIDQKAKSTKYKDTSDYNTFHNFCKSINEHRDFAAIPELDLDNIICQFFMKALTRKGNLYEPDSLTSIRNSLQRILTERGSKYDLKFGENFQKSRSVLASRRLRTTVNKDYLLYLLSFITVGLRNVMLVYCYLNVILVKIKVLFFFFPRFECFLKLRIER